MARSPEKFTFNFNSRACLAGLLAVAAWATSPLALRAQNLPLLQPQEVVEQLQERFQAYNTYKADFEELNHRTLKQGMFALEKPNNLYIAYLEKTNKVVEIYVNSTHMVIYLKKIHIVFEQELNLNNPTEANNDLENYEDIQEVFNEPWSQLSRLTERYNFNFAHSRDLVNLISPLEVSPFRKTYSNMAYHLRLTPKKVDMGLKRLELWVSEEGDILRSRAIAFNNRKLDLVFSNVEVNPVLSPNTFEFILPPNVQVFKNSLIKKGAAPKPHPQ